MPNKKGLDTRTRRHLDGSSSSFPLSSRARFFPSPPTFSSRFSASRARSLCSSIADSGIGELYPLVAVFCSTCARLTTVSVLTELFRSATSVLRRRKRKSERRTKPFFLLRLRKSSNPSGMRLHFFPSLDLRRQLVAGGKAKKERNSPNLPALSSSYPALLVSLSHRPFVRLLIFFLA